MKSLALILTLLSCQLCAQDTASQGGEYEKEFQISFISPMGTNGTESHKYTNRVSINIFGGLHGGVNGFEAGGFANVIKNDVNGVQAAGFSNTVLGNVRGVQAAGFVNVAKGKVDGVQGAGFVNVAIESSTAVQGSGFANVIRGDNAGFQGSGFSNVVTGDLKGAQATGFSNVVRGELDGFQGAGFSNVTIGDVDGAQVAGFVNVAKGNVRGGQGAGFINVAVGDVDRAQIAGFANVAHGNVKGAQISGFFNKAKNVEGVQAGFLNIADSVKGVPIGFLSIVKKGGYHRFELSGGESLHAAFNVKLGVKKFYNIFSIGTRQDQSNFFWAYGYGIGTWFPMGAKSGMNFDLMAYHVNPGVGHIGDVNLLNRLQMQYSYQPGKKTQLFIGPALNVMVTTHTDNEGLPLEPTFAPWMGYEETNSGTYVGVYAGFNAGLRF